MHKYALLINNEFKEIRSYKTKPENIPHKNITWYEVVYEQGNTEFNGLENDKWVIRTIDPALEPPKVPEFITSRQVRLFLLQQNLLDDVELMIQNESREAQIQWEYATNFNRNDPLLNSLATKLEISQEDLDQFFIAAANI